MKDVNGEEFFSYLEEFEKDEEKDWFNLSESKKQDCFKYLTLIKRFMKNNLLLNNTHKKWVLENCDLPTHLIPVEQMDGYFLDGSSGEITNNLFLISIGKINKTIAEFK